MRRLAFALALVTAPAAAGTPPAPRLAGGDTTATAILALDPAARRSAAERRAVFASYVRAVRRELETGDPELALHLADHGTALFPELRRPWVHLAAARLARGLWGPAIEAARRAERAADDSWSPAPTPAESPAAPAYWEGVALHRTQRHDEALPRLRAARAGAPAWAEAARALGAAAFVGGNMQEAADAYAAAFAIDPSLGDAQDLSYYAEARAASGDIDTSIAALQEALRRAPYEPGLHAKLGDLLRRDGDLVEAYYELVLELALHGVESPFAAPALEMSNLVVQQARADSTHPGAHELRAVAAGLASLHAGRAHFAAHDLRHALGISRSANPVPRLLLADAYLRDGKPDRAEEELQKLLAADPEFVPALFALSEVQAQGGRQRDAERTREHVRSLFPAYWKLEAAGATRP